MISDRHEKILEARGLDVELLERFGIASASRKGSDWIVIPVFEGGVLVNRVYRTIAGEKQFSQDQGGKQIFWNSDVIADETLANQPLIITEGHFDALSAIIAGYARTVSVPNGAPAEASDDPSQRYKFIDLAPRALHECREIILAVDNDGPGTNLLNDLALRLGRARCKWVKYQKGCKDLNDALREYGLRGVTESIVCASWMEVDGLYRLSELPPLPPSIPHVSGFPGLDNHYRLRLGDLSIITGIPSHGKSTFTNEIICRMAMKHNWKAAMASFEQSPQRDHRRWLRTWYSGKYERDQDARELAEADGWIDKTFLFVVPNENDDPTLDWILERFHTAVIRHGVKICLIDPWNEVEEDRPLDVSLTQYIGQSLRRLKRVARKLQVHMMVVAHPMKMRRNENGKYPFPSLYDVSDSAHWYNRCDVGVIVYRDGDSSTIRVAKSRYHDQIGEPGDVNVRYVPHRAKYELIEEMAH